MKKASSPRADGGHVFRRIKILRTILEKGHTRNNTVKLLQILTNGFGEEDFLRISSCPYSAKSLPPPPPHGSHVFQRIKISHTISEKGHPRKNPVKLIPNRTKDFREEDFFRIS